MSLLVSTASIIGGIILLVVGAEALVRGAGSLAKKMSISEMVIGLTVVAFGTSAPELVVNTFAAAGHQHDIVFGNIIGSNMANILLVLGVAGLIYPLRILKNTVWKEIPFLLAATVLVFLLVHDGWFGEPAVNLLSRNEGLVLLGLFVGFLAYTYSILRAESPDREVRTYATWASVLLLLAGLGGLFIGGRFTVNGAVAVARQLGVSEKMIAATIIALGTSLPELVTSAVAAYRRRCDLAVGNVVGSSIFNLLMVLGVSGVVRPVNYSPSFDVDSVVLLAATVLLFVTMFTGKRHRLDRPEAALMLVGYAAYIGYLVYQR